MVSLTHWLTRTRSFQVLADSTTSRGFDGALAHSAGFSVQNSTQPIGGRVTSATDTWIARSGEMLAGIARSKAAAPGAPRQIARIAVAAPSPCSVFVRHGIRDPSPVRRGSRFAQTL